jgi:hypothetical protein
MVYRITTKYFGLVVLGAWLFLILNPPTLVQSQTAGLTASYAWRSAGVVIYYPAEWHVGEYDDLPVLVSTADGLAKAANGEAPGVPALGLLSYPQTNDLTAEAMLQTLFPDQTGLIQGRFAGTTSREGEFTDTETNQHIKFIGFRSPVTNNTQVLMAIAPPEAWEGFQPIWEDILASAEFFDGDAHLAFEDGEVSFQYPTRWQKADNGQVMVAAPTVDIATRVVNGDLTIAAPFIRVQLLVPSGLGIDGSAEDSPVQILARFIGEPLPKNIHQFAWAEDVPAASVEFEFADLTLVLVAVVQDDVSLLIGGGAPTAQWPSARHAILSTINFSVFNEITPPTQLNAFIAGETPTEAGIFGVVVAQ